MTSPFTDQFTGLYATPELVGRKDILEKFERILRDDAKTPKLVFLSGPGGIGKTRLLKKALEMASALCQNGRIAHDILDFYRVMLHTPIGLVNAVFEILTPPSSDCFQSYQSAYKALNRARLYGIVTKLEELRDHAINNFTEDLKQLSASHRIVLTLDTAERVVYGLSGWTDEIPLADSWNWLIERLPSWGNVVIFVAGREEARPAIETMQKAYPALVEEIEVGPFSEDESLEYFYKVAQLAETNKDYHLVERLKNLPLDLQRRAHDYSQGRPMLLSLFVDYLSFPGESEVMELLRQPLPKEKREEDYLRFEEGIFKRLKETEVGKTLIALGRVPKGADAELLAALLEIPIPEARKRLEDVKCLSVVKVRSEDQRIFLHDEMYALLQRQVYASPYDIDAQKAAFEAIKNYYQKQRDVCVGRLAELYAPVEEEGRENLDLERITEVYAERQAILSEMMFYFLRQDFERGFRHYYRYSQEAIYSNDVLMDMHLQAEILNFIVKLPDENIKRQVSGEFSPQMLLAALQLRPIMRSWAESKFEEAIEKSSQLLKLVENSWKNHFPAVLGALHIWTAYAHAMQSNRNDLDKADRHLESAFLLFPAKEIDEQLSDKSPTERWYIKALMALAYRIRGYLLRVRGFPQQGIEDYYRAIEFLSDLDIRVEKATALNDIGFALAIQGKWHDGRSLTRDALELRRELGHRLPVAFSLNTLAMIDIYEGQYDSAQKNAERALAIFRARYDERGKGLALIALAESRRRSATTNLILDSERRIELIRQARDNAEEAITIFSQSVTEPPRRIEALIEFGCACRDWVRLRKDYPNPKDNVPRLIQYAEEYLLMAYELAKAANIKYRAVDARVNLAWLRYYTVKEGGVIDDAHPVIESIRIAHETIPSEYFFSDKKKPIERAGAQIEIWPQLGKLYLLEGHIEYYRFDQIPKNEKKEFALTGKGKQIVETLNKIAEKYAESLEYSALYEKDYRGIRGAKDRIYEKIKGLNIAERREICKKIRDLYPNHDSVIEGLLRDRVLWLD